MPLRERVGRHLQTGKHCRNWKSDQQHVIALLNRFPAEYGGAAGSLNGRIVAGLASDALYQAILRFQKHQVPIQTGFISPGDLSLQVLERNAVAPAAPAPARPANQWDSVNTRSVNKALREGLNDDQQLSHAEAVNIVRSTLSDGIITPYEMDDLKTIATISKSLSPRSKKMLISLAEKIKDSEETKGPYGLRSDQHRQAAGMVCDFLERSGAGQFPNLDRDEVGVGMLMRICNPGILDQDKGSLCGPAAMLFSVLTDAPIAYARYAIDLFEKGKAKLYKLEIEPSKDCRNFRPPSSMAHVDWLTMASLRDSENWFLDFDSVSVKGDVAGITTPQELVRWFRRAGFSDIRNGVTDAILPDQRILDLLIEKGPGSVADANKLFGEGYRVCLFINAGMLKEADQSEAGTIFDRHWVVQRSPIDLSNGKVRLQVFTYGQGNWQIPNGSTDLPHAHFFQNFFGYIAAKW